MIRLIVAIDSKRGLANDKGIPWHLPLDIKYFRDKIADNIILMGSGVYKELSKPLPAKRNLVVTRNPDDLKAGFEKVDDLERFLQNTHEDIWVIGGAMVYAESITYADELYLTLLDGYFGCTKFFPAYENDFVQNATGTELQENGISFRFTVWKRKVPFTKQG